MSRMLSVTREAQAQQQQRTFKNRSLQFCIGIFWSKGQNDRKSRGFDDVKAIC